MQIYNQSSSLNKISDKFIEILSKASFKVHTFLNSSITRYYRSEEYVLGVDIREGYIGSRAYIKSSDLENSFQIAKRDLERCDNKNLPGCFWILDEWQEAFKDKDGAYAIFDKTGDNLEMPKELHLCALYDNQNEKISNLLRKLKLSFFITRDLIDF